MAFEDEQVNDVLPGSPGGLIEAVKTAIVFATRSAVTGTSLSSQDSAVNVSMEYPNTLEKYPAIWVQFSLSTLQPSGMGMVQYDPSTGDSLRHFSYTGRVSLAVVALSNIERDRLSDYLVNMLAFSRVSIPNLVTEDGVQETFTDLYEYLDKDPHLSMTVNTDSFRPMGQSTTFGTAWDPTALVYEDAYAFDVIGHFMVERTNDGYYILRRVDVLPEIDTAHGTYRPGTWY
jgi:hypothetical protein